MKEAKAPAWRPTGFEDLPWRDGFPEGLSPEALATMEALGRRELAGEAVDATLVCRGPDGRMRRVEVMDEATFRRRWPALARRYGRGGLRCSAKTLRSPSPRGGTCSRAASAGPRSGCRSAPPGTS